ncbi:hypothetical protein OXX79_007356 [Metschnikowia pulcherrima]
MALYYNLVFGLLVIEMAFFTVLSLPFPRAMRKSVLRTVSMPFRSEQFQIAFKCVFGFVLVLFIDSVNRVASLLRSAQHVLGFTLFLTLILTRTYSLVAELITTKDKLDNVSTTGELGSSAEATGLKKDLAEKDAELTRLKNQASSLSSEYDAASKK